jgi:hypothetical protein
MPAIVVKITAATRMRMKFMWMPGSSAARSATRMWRPFSSLIRAKNSEPNQPIV